MTPIFLPFVGAGLIVHGFLRKLLRSMWLFMN